MTFPIRKSARKLTGIVKITIPEVFPERKPLGNVIIFPVCQLNMSIVNSPSLRLGLARSVEQLWRIG